MRTSGWLVPVARAVAVVAILATALPSGTPALSATAPEPQSAQTSNPGLPAAVTPTGSLTQATTTPIATPTATERLAQAQHSSPLLFVQNVGQFDPQVRFQVRTGGATIWLTDDAVWITLLDKPISSTTGLGQLPPFTSSPTGQLANLPETPANRLAALLDRSPAGGRFPATRLGQATAPRGGVNLKLSFPGANLAPRLEPLNRQPTRVSYFEGSDPSQWHPDVPAWGGLRYHNLYPGIDLEILGDSGQWAWRLASATDTGSGAAQANRPSLTQSLPAVRLRVEGADAARIDANELRLSTAAADLSLPLLGVIDAPPPSAPTIAGEGTDITIAQPFERQSPHTPSGASLAPTDSSGLVYSTYLGGNNGDQGNGIAVDGSGNAYVTGWAYSTNFPTSPGAFQTTLGGYDDAFVTKLNPSGSALVYSTYLGGNGGDAGYGIAVDGSGNAYVTGETDSTNFPTSPGAFQTTFGGGSSNAFLTKLTSSGTGLVYSTYLGGSGGDYGTGIALDGSGNAYVTGVTGSTDFPTVPGSFRTTSSGTEEAFVTKVNASGTDLVYSTYLGGCGFPNRNLIAVDGSGNAYVTGSTYSPNFPTTPDAFMPTWSGGINDMYVAFVTKVNAAGTDLVYSTFLGGSSADWGSGIAVDGGGNAYVTGYAGSSTDFPTTPGAFQTTLSGGAFVTKFNATGASLIYSTYLGGSSGGVSATSIAVDGSGNAFVTGGTTSSNFPTTPGAFQTTYAGGGYYGDAFVTKLNSGGTALIYSTYLGGGSDDDGQGIAIDGSGNAYVTGETTSTNFPTTPGAFQTTLSGGSDAFVTKLAMGGTGSITPTPTPSITPTPTPATTLSKGVVVLVPGFGGLDPNPADQQYCSDGIIPYVQGVAVSQEDKGLADLAQWLTADGFETWFAHITTGILFTDSIENNGGCLANEIKSAAKDASSGRVTLIGYSMGGLVSRAYLEGGSYAGNVDRLITLGTPHQGAGYAGIVWYMNVFESVGTLCLTQVAACEMTTGIGSFESTYNHRNPNVNYYLSGGSASATNLGSYPIGWVLSSLAGGSSDGFISTTSSLGLDSVVQTYSADEVHVPNLLGNWSYLNASLGQTCSDSYSNFIRPILLGQPPTLANCPTGSLPQVTQRATSAPRTPTISTAALLPPILGSLTSNKTVSQSLSIDGGTTSFVATWLSGTITVTLTSPSGLTIDPIYAAANPNLVTYSPPSSSQSFGIAGYQVANAQPGLWKVNLQAASLPSGTTNYNVSVTVNSPITLSAGVDRTWYAPGSTAVISATLGGGVTANLVTAQVQRTDGITDTLTLAPQGNGQYTGTDPVPTIPGYESAVVTATGTDSLGNPFSRQASVGMLVGSQHAILSGSYADQLSDDNGDGYPDSLAVTVGITATAVSTYTVSAQLVAPTTGAVIAQTSSSAALATGSQAVVLHFPGSSIYASGVDGPYQVTSVVLLEQDPTLGLLPIQSATNAWTTQAYSYNVFAPPPTPTPSITPTPLPSSTATPSITITPTITPTASGTPTVTDTPTIIDTSTATPSETATGTTTSSPTTTPTPSSTPTASPTPQIMTTVVAGATVSVSIPAESTPIVQLVVIAPVVPPAITPFDPHYQPVLAIEIDAFDGLGNAIHDLSAPLTISIRFTPLPTQNALLAQIYTIDRNGNSQALPTLVTADGDGSYTAVAQTSHLSPFEIFAPNVGTPVPLLFLPVAPDGVVASGW